MDLQQFGYWLLLIFLVLILLIKYLRPLIKGYLGELTIRFILSFLKKKDYKVIHNVRVFYNGIMAQIDHIVVSKYGLFVIETKNYSGWIFGSENAHEWTQVIFKHKFKLYNPIKQNFGHIKAIRANLTAYPFLDYYPIVVFTRGSKLKINSSYPVIKYYNLLKTIKNSKNINITENIRDEVYETLLKINGRKPLIQPKKALLSSFARHTPTFCPYCSSPLISKTGKYGRFLGCSSFPKCHYSKKVSFKYE